MGEKLQVILITIWVLLVYNYLVVNLFILTY